MAYRLKLKEPLVKGVRRIAGEQLANAATRLQQDSDIEKSVHEARKGLKRTRALLRLVRPGLGEAQFRPLNQRLREIAQALSATRDRDVVRELLHGLARGKPAHRKAARRLLALLDTAPTTGRHTQQQTMKNVADAAREIIAARKGFEKINLDPADFDAVVAGLTKSHRSGRRALGRALRNPDEEEPLHDLRKAAQAYWRHMILVQHAWPEACLARASAAKRVADLLGQDHDVALLEAVLVGPQGQALTGAERAALARACAAKHAELRDIALPEAQLLFAENSERLGHHMRELWEAARRSARPSPSVVKVGAVSGARKPS